MGRKQKIYECMFHGGDSAKGAELYTKRQAELRDRFLRRAQKAEKQLKALRAITAEMDRMSVAVCSKSDDNVFTVDDFLEDAERGLSRATWAAHKIR